MLAVVTVLVLGLLAEGIFDSAIGAWVAFGALAAILVMKAVGWVGLWPEGWPDLFGDGD